MIQPFQNKRGGELGQNIMGPHLQEVTVGNQYTCISLRILRREGRVYPQYKIVRASSKKIATDIYTISNIHIHN